MQDGRRVLEPRATRTLPIDRNERDIVRTRETSSGSGERRKIKREKESERIRGLQREKERQGKKMNNMWERRKNIWKDGQGDTPGLKGCRLLHEETRRRQKGGKKRTER